MAIKRIQGVVFEVKSDATGSRIELVVLTEMEHKMLKLFGASDKRCKVTAIKWLREKTGLGLKDAKDIIDHIFEEGDYEDRKNSGYVERSNPPPPPPTDDSWGYPLRA